MKNLFNLKSLVVIVFTILAFSSCNDKSKDIIPSNQTSFDVVTASTSNSLAGSTDPTISSISASLSGGKSFFNKDVDYSSYLQANNTGTSIVTIRGANFGSTAGTIKVDGGYSVTNITWSSTSIKGTLNCSASSKAGNITFSVTPKGSSKSVYYAALLCPFLNTRRYGQCTFYCTSQRILRNLTVPSPAYQQTATISGSYLAQTGDILHWSGTHQAMITGVTQDSNNRNLYTFFLNEMNGEVGDGTVLSYSFKIEFNRDSKNNIISRKSGNYYSSLYKTTGASSYYR